MTLPKMATRNYIQDGGQKESFLTSSMGTQTPYTTDMTYSACTKGLIMFSSPPTRVCTEVCDGGSSPRPGGDVDLEWEFHERLFRGWSARYGAITTVGSVPFIFHPRFVYMDTFSSSSLSPLATSRAALIQVAMQPSYGELHGPRVWGRRGSSKEMCDMGITYNCYLLVHYELRAKGMVSPLHQQWRYDSFCPELMMIFFNLLAFAQGINTRIHDIAFVSWEIRW